MTFLYINTSMKNKIQELMNTFRCCRVNSLGCLHNNFRREIHCKILNSLLICMRRTDKNKIMKINIQQLMDTM